MTCNPAPKRNFLYGFFHYDLLEDAIGVEITVQTPLTGIYTFRKDHNAQLSVCSPWGSCIKPFPLLQKKKEAYIKERQTNANPFNYNQSFPSRSNPSSFAKLPRATPKRKRTVKANPRKMRKNYTPSTWVTFNAQLKEDSTRQMETPFTITNLITATPAMFAATPNPPITVTSQISIYCVMCSALGRPCPTFFPPAPTVSPPYSNWSDTGEEDWDGEKQRERGKKEQKEKRTRT